MSSINASTFISETTLYIRDVLANNVTDPISGTRPDNSQFVVTKYPEKVVVYPLVSVMSTNISTDRLGMSSEKLFAQVPFEVRVWARSVDEKDQLTEEVIDTLRTNQYANSGSATVSDAQIYGYNVSSAVNIDEPGRQGPKSKVITINYQVVL